MLHVRISTQKFKFIAPLISTIRNIKCVCGTHFQPFNIVLKPVLTNNCCLEHINHHLKIMHFSVKNTNTIFCIFLPTGVYRMLQYVICIGICSLEQSQLSLQISLKLKISIESYRVPNEWVRCIEPNGNLYSDPYQIMSSIFY